MLDLVLVHAFPFDRRMWDPLGTRLADVARLHAPDLPGFGSSGAPPADSVDAMADAVRAFVDAKGLERFVLGGLSMGGYVTFAYWRRHARDRRPVGLVLADTKAQADGPEARRARDETAAAVRREGRLGPYADRMLPRLLGPQASPAVVERARALVESQTVEAVATGALALRDRPNAVALLGGIDVPTLVLCGEHDAVTPLDGMRDLAGRIPGASFVPVAHAGHLASLEQPVAFEAALRRFLAVF